MPAPSAAVASSGPTPTTPPGNRSRRHRWWLLAAGLALVVLAAAGAIALLVRRGGDPAARPVGPPAATAPQRASGPAAASADPNAPLCRYELAPGEGTAPRPPERAALSGTVRVTLHTNQGPISLELDATKAPCTVNSFVSLAGADFYNDSPCHRLTTSAIFVLQCGDPTASGSGGPGYRFGDENLPVNVGPAYPRGTVAMANAGPDTNGSQFFLVYRDSNIDPNYPVFGRITDGLELLDEVAEAGAPGNDGPPNLEVVVEGVEVS